MTTPIFIMGVAPQCGTNYLEDLLCVHPDCGLGIPLRENQLLGRLPDLSAVVESLRTDWAANQRWGFQPEHANDLARSIGAALSDFTIAQVDDRRRIDTPPDTLPGIEHAFKQSPPFLISKHPRTTGLAAFRTFFPNEKLILLMRDGRAVTESSMRSWGWHFDVAVDSWRQGASDIEKFLDNHPEDSALFVRYEDLITDPEAEIGRIFQYIDLDPTLFDFERAIRRPVRGSSTVRPEGAGTSVAWHPVEKTDDFDPLARAREWTDAQHARFNHMAGRISERFGYPVVEVDKATASAVRHTVRDLMFKARVATRPLRRVLARTPRG